MYFHGVKSTAHPPIIGALGHSTNCIVKQPNTAKKCMVLQNLQDWWGWNDENSFKNMNCRELSLNASKFEMYFGSTHYQWGVQKKVVIASFRGPEHQTVVSKMSPRKFICSANDFSWPLARGVGKWFYSSWWTPGNQEALPSLYVQPTTAQWNCLVTINTSLTA